MRFLICALLLAMGGPTVCRAQDQVTWILERFEPYYIHEGPLQGQGVADRLLALIQKELPEFKHEQSTQPILRIRESLKRRDQAVCISFLKDASLSDFAQYSGVTMLVPPLELTLRREEWVKNWKSAPTISLVQFLQKGGVVGVAAGRRYGVKLDALVSPDSPFAKQIYSRIGNHYSGLTEMVHRGRIAGTIGYSAELRFVQRGNPELSSLVSVPLEENTRPLYVYAVIPKSEWGNQFKQKLDAALLRVRGTPAYTAAITDWFGASEAWKAEYRDQVLTGKMDGPSRGF